MSVPTIEGITARTVMTERLATRVLFSGPDDGIPVLFLHGNLSSATWWEETMVALPPAYRGIAPDQRGYGEADPAAKVHAVHGMAEYAPLWCKSNYSFLEGASHPEELVETAADLGLAAIGLPGSRHRRI